MNSVIKGASYVLVHTPDMVLYNGTTQTTERVVNPDSEYLKAVPEHLRSYEEAVSYWPNQTYIGNAPNFMVKSISDENGVKMPSFFGYIVWSLCCLVPVFLIDTLLFFI